ncbi:unnamed protein product [Menidia menidia]|uniref:(Atlantic silverside) hypothetical protein n=1 Tax=Menidia menidia TaxID=238744 RepID=A0A8S4A8R6_9TELE|nr:unnamed protein product [Menidia menidia]
MPKLLFSKIRFYEIKDLIPNVKRPRRIDIVLTRKRRKKDINCLSSEFSEENIEFWLACEDFRSTATPDDLLSRAEKIYRDFIQPTACREVSLMPGDENIEFWLTCEDYKKIKSSFRMSSRAKKIYEQFIKAESPKEINIDYHTREQIKRNVKTPTVHCFDDAQKIVYGLMERDSYPRFLRSDIYRTLLESFAADATKG